MLKKILFIISITFTFIFSFSYFKIHAIEESTNFRIKEGMNLRGKTIYIDFSLINDFSSMKQFLFENSISDYITDYATTVGGNLVNIDTQFENVSEYSLFNSSFILGINTPNVLKGSDVYSGKGSYSHNLRLNASCFTDNSLAFFIHYHGTFYSFNLYGASKYYISREITNSDGILNASMISYTFGDDKDYIVNFTSKYANDIFWLSEPYTDYVSKIQNEIDKQNSYNDGVIVGRFEKENELKDYIDPETHYNQVNESFDAGYYTGYQESELEYSDYISPDESDRLCQNSLDNGYDIGYKEAEKDLHNYYSDYVSPDIYENDIKKNYELGYAEGRLDGKEYIEAVVNLPNFIPKTVVSIYNTVIDPFISFEVLGISIRNLLIWFVSGMIVLAILKRFR